MQSHVDDNQRTNSVEGCPNFVCLPCRISDEVCRAGDDEPIHQELGKDERGICQHEQQSGDPERRNVFEVIAMQAARAINVVINFKLIGLLGSRGLSCFAASGRRSSILAPSPLRPSEPMQLRRSQRSGFRSQFPAS